MLEIAQTTVVDKLSTEHTLVRISNIIRSIPQYCADIESNLLTIQLFELAITAIQFCTKKIHFHLRNLQRKIKYPLFKLLISDS